MPSTSLSKKQWDSTWAGLPREIRLLILEVLMRDGCSLARFATVSREWQTVLGRYNFARIKLTPARLDAFAPMTRRNRALVGYIWFCLELDAYDCTTCAPVDARMTMEEIMETYAINDTNCGPITAAFEILFSVLSTWDPDANLILDISIYSPSDPEHWFKYLTVMPDTPAGMLGSGGGGVERPRLNGIYHDPQHGWVNGIRHSAPPRGALDKIFHAIMEDGPFDTEKLELQWWDELPTVPAVTSLYLRQQNRRRWRTTALAHMFARFPRLREVHYEPWREWSFIQDNTDGESQYLFESVQRSNHDLKRLVAFENFNQQYPTIMRRFMNGEDIIGCDKIRNPAPAVSRTLARASLEREHLAASFLVDASHFFAAIEPAWAWPNLTSLVLTSKLLTPDADPTEIGAMLQAAAAAALKMQLLDTLEIWNGRRGLAALFRYQALRPLQQAVITWKGTWNLATMEPPVVQAWEAVVHHHRSDDGWELEWVQEEELDGAVIKSHADAIDHLALKGQVIRPVSLRQIRTEQEALEGLPVVQ